MTEALIVFARLPVAGSVKTRLAKTLGEDFAVRFYRACAEHTFNECRKAASTGMDIFVFYSDEKDKELMKKWTGNDFRLLPQSGEDIGKRMFNAFKIVFDEGVNRAILIGTDVPDISSGIISKALTSLNNTELVIGPAKDGGYYLIGMKKLYGFLFENIEWGTGKVFAGTLDKINMNNLDKKIITELYDIDTEEDITKWLSAKQEDEINPVGNFIKEYFSSGKAVK
jgi:rSAM/selenodomain-associated transferase 1